MLLSAISGFSLRKIARKSQRVNQKYRKTPPPKGLFLHENQQVFWQKSPDPVPRTPEMTVPQAFPKSKCWVATSPIHSLIGFETASNKVHGKTEYYGCKHTEGRHHVKIQRCESVTRLDKHSRPRGTIG